MTTTTALPELSRVRREQYGIEYYAVHNATHSIQFEVIPSTGYLSGIFTCEVTAEPAGGVQPLGEVQWCPYLGHCTCDAYGRAATDKVRERFEALGSAPEDDAVFALLAELHATDWPVAS